VKSRHVGPWEPIGTNPKPPVLCHRKKVRELMLILWSHFEDPRGETGRPRPKHPTGTLRDRVCEETPTSNLESLTVMAKAQPQSRRGGLPMESHCLIIRNPSSFSKKNLLDIRFFFENNFGYTELMSIKLARSGVKTEGV